MEREKSMNIRENTNTIGMVVSTLPESKEIFKQYGIDFCCGGNRKLVAVMEEGNLNKEQIYVQLEKAYEDRMSKSNIENIADADPMKLTIYIEDKHHGYLREMLPKGLELLLTLVRVHGSTHSELFKIYQLYGQLKTELEQHLLKEETILFPELLKGDNAKLIKEVSKEIISEHEGAGQILRGLREITNDYTPPADGCETYKRTFALLEEIEQDLHEHIHLENNVLLKEYDHRA